LRQDPFGADVVHLERQHGQLPVVRVVLHEQDAGEEGVGRHASSPRVKKKAAPWSGFPSAQMRPPWRWTIRATVASPMPVPSNSASEWRRWKARKSLSEEAMPKPAPLSFTKEQILPPPASRVPTPNRRSEPRS